MGSPAEGTVYDKLHYSFIFLIFCYLLWFYLEKINKAK